MSNLMPVTYGCLVKVHFGGVDLELIIVGYDPLSKIVSLIDRIGSRYQLTKHYTKGKATGERLSEDEVLKIVADAYARRKDSIDETYDISA